ncbi:MAG TPA: hypothetical protein VHL05_15770, partial [Terriglobales bacterium]|nr:hypothetical protein [Terriglobales bacterium]
RHVEPTGVRHIRYRDRNARVGDFAACDILCYGFKVGTSSGKQNANILHKVVSRWSSASGYSSTSQTSDNHREMQESRVSLRKASTYFVDNSCGCFFEQLTWDSVIEAADKSWVGSEDLET